jgi:tape measure domain-containing protein
MAYAWNGLLNARPKMEYGIDIIVDPRKAQSGSATVKSAVKDMAGSVVRDAKTAGDAASSIGAKVQSSATQAASGTGRIAGAFDRLSQRARAAVTGVGSAFDRMVSGLSSKTGQVSRIILDFANGIGLMNNRVGMGVNQLAGLGSTFSTLSTAAKAAGFGVAGFAAVMGPLIALLAGAVAVFAAVAGSLALITSSMKAAGGVQQGQAGLKAVIGDAGEAIRVMEELRSISRRTGADLGASITSTLKFTALGFTPDDAIKLNKSISDVAGTLGMSQAAASELGNALAQVQAKGVVSMEELRQQIAEKGIPVMEDLAKKMGVTGSELIKMVGDGQVPAKALIDIFLNLEGSFAKFAGGAERATQTLPGALARLSAVFNDLLITMGSPINDAITPLINDISDALMNLQDEAQLVGDYIGNAIKTLRGLAGVTMLSDQQLAVKGYASGFELVMKGAWDTIKSYAAQIIGALGDVLRNRFELATYSMRLAFAEMQKPEFWRGLSTELKNTALEFVDTISLGLFSAAKEMQAMVGSVSDNLTRIGKGVLTLDGGMIYDGLTGQKSPTTSSVPTAPSMPTAPKELSMSEALANNAKANTSAQTDLAAELARVMASQTPAQTGGTAVSNAGYSPVESIAPKGGAGSGGGTSEADRMRSEAERIIQSTMTPQEAFDQQIANLERLRDAGHLTTEQYRRGWEQAREGFVSDTEQMAQAAQAMIERNMSGFQRMMLSWGDITTQMDDAAQNIGQSISSNIGNAMTNWITGAQSASEAFSQMAKSIVSDIIQITTRLLIQYAIQAALGGVGAISVPSVPVAAVAHTGGTVGQDRLGRRSVSASTFEGARRFQHGGMIGGVGSGETPAIMEPGESVLTRDQAGDIKKRLSSGGEQPSRSGGDVTILNVVDPTLIESHIARNPSIVLNMISANASKVRRSLGMSGA